MAAPLVLLAEPATHAPTAASKDQPNDPTWRGASVESPRRRVPRTTEPANGTARQFRVHFRGQRVFEAQGVRDALGQAEALGLIEIVEVMCLD